MISILKREHRQQISLTQIFYKLLSNSLYGKTIEHPEKQNKVKLCNESSMYENYIGKPNFKNAKRINSKLVGVEMKYSSIKINKPFYIGISILDLSKWHMYNFHYNVMKAIFGDKSSFTLHGHRFLYLHNIIC